MLASFRFELSKQDLDKIKKCIFEINSKISIRLAPIDKLHITAYSLRDKYNSSIHKKIIDKVLSTQISQEILKFNKLIIIKKNIIVAQYVPSKMIINYVNNIEKICIDNNIITENKGREYNPHITIGKLKNISDIDNLNIIFPDICISKVYFDVN